MVIPIVHSTVYPALRCMLHKAGALSPSQFIRNGDFSSGDFWDTNQSWTIAKGYAEDSGNPVTPGGDALRQTLIAPLKAGKSYTISMDISGFANGLRVRLGSQELSLATSSPYSATFTASAAHTLVSLIALVREMGTVDNVSLVPA